MHTEEPHRSQAEAFYYAALDAIAEGNPRTAIKACRDALSLCPQYSDAMHALIRAHQDAGEFDQGIAIAQQLATLDPEDVLAHTSLSILYQHKGLVPQAEAAALKAKLLAWKQQLRAGKASGPAR